MARTIGLVAWARSVELVIAERRVSPGTARALLVLLAEHANKRTCSVLLSRAVLAEILNIHVDAVKRTLRELDPPT